MSSSRKKKTTGKPVKKKKSGMFGRRKTGSDNVFALSSDNPMFEVANPAFDSTYKTARTTSYGRTATLEELDSKEATMTRTASLFGVQPPPGAVDITPSKEVRRPSDSKPRRLSNGLFAPQPPGIPKHLYEQCQTELTGAIDTIKSIVKEKGTCSGAELEELSHVISVSKARGVSVGSSEVLSEALRFESKIRDQLTAARSVENAIEDSDFKKLKKVIRTAERKGVKVEMKFKYGADENASRGNVPSLALPMSPQKKR